MSDKVRLIDANALGKAIELLCEDERINMTAITYFVLCELLDTMPTIEAEHVKQDSQLSIILQDYGIDNVEQLRYILDQYQKLIVEITRGQMSYLTYPAQAVLECANDRYLSALADLKESSNEE